MSVPSALVRMACCGWPGQGEAGRLVPATVCTSSVTVTRVNSWAAERPRPVPPSRARCLFLENSLRLFSPQELGASVHRDCSRWAAEDGILIESAFIVSDTRW